MENAEKLNFENQSFDYVFCKEALHHFPRPYVALYEMLRVARKGVFLVEPNDAWSLGSMSPSVDRQSLFVKLRHHFLRVLDIARYKLPYIKYNQADWEPSGNYVFALSARELEKIALGSNLPQIVTKGLNDHYIKGCEFEPADIEQSDIFAEIVRVIENRDKLCKQGYAKHSLIMAGLLLQPLENNARNSFIKAGWSLQDLPANPYIARDY